MTSDAKIGLLLGLVFIFIIAFVINGMPRFRNALENNDITATEDFVQPEPIGSSVRNTPGLFEQPLAEEPVNSAVSNDDNRPELTYHTPSWSNDSSDMQAEHADQSHYPPTYYTQNSIIEQTTDYVAPAPENSDQQDLASSENLQDQNIDRYHMQFAFNANSQNEGGLTQLANNTQDQPRFQSAGQGGRWNGNRPFGGQGGIGQGTPRQGGQQDQSSQHQHGQEGQPNQMIQPKTYIIQEGDSNLAKIAKKFYGEEEGNRIINVTRLYEANKDVLKSADKIFVGQKIVIPPPVPAANPQPADILRGTMFQTVPSIGRAGNIMPPTANSQDTGRWYEVKKDDSLWKIAFEQLGKGSRFNEISELNTDILANKNKLMPGMKLRLPAK